MSTETPDYDAIAQKHYRALCESATQRKQEWINRNESWIIELFMGDLDTAPAIDRWESEGGR